MENGLGTIDETDEHGYVEDDERIQYLRNHIQAMKDAIVGRWCRITWLYLLGSN